MLDLRWCRGPLDLNAKDMDGVGNVLESLLPKIDKTLLKLAADLMTYALGTDNFPRSRQQCQSRCGIDVITMQVVTIDDHVTKVDAQSKPDMSIRR